MNRPSEAEKLAHLGYIQNVVARMAHEANSLKSWLLPVVTAAYGYAIVAHSWKVALVGIAACLLMGWQAASYLQEEKAYRKLYNATIKGEVEPFSMNATPFKPKWFTRESALWSWSIAGFFGAIVIAGIVIAICSIALY